jgi:hypothetical protein
MQPALVVAIGVAVFVLWIWLSKLEEARQRRADALYEEILQLLRNEPKSAAAHARVLELFGQLDTDTQKAKSGCIYNVALSILAERLSEKPHFLATLYLKGGWRGLGSERLSIPWMARMRIIHALESVRRS